MGEPRASRLRGAVAELLTSELAVAERSQGKTSSGPRSLLRRLRLPGKRGCAGAGKAFKRPTFGSLATESQWLRIRRSLPR